MQTDRLTGITDNVKYGHDLGWSFTPLTGKKPKLPGWQKRPRESEAQALAWAKAGNVGLRTGKASGLIVIDVDAGGDISGLNLPGTVTVNTGRNGIHLYYRYSGKLRIGNSAGKLGPHIDVRGEGGQVVFPGSIHPDTGKRYEWADGFGPEEVEIAELPQHIVDLLAGAKPVSKPPRGPQVTNGPRLTRYITTAVDREIQNILTASKGSWNHTLNAAAYALGQLVGGGYIGRPWAEETLKEAVKQAGWDTDSNGERQTAATIRSGLESGLAQPRRVALRDAPATTPAPGSPSDYILTPGAHTDEGGKYLEINNPDFGAAVLAKLPEDAIYQKDRIPGELIGGPGERRWYQLGPVRMMHLVDAAMKLGAWKTKKSKEPKQVMVFQPCRMDWGKVLTEYVRGAEGVRRLELLVNYPVYGPGWKRVEPGWHGGYYYDEPPAMRGLKPETDCEVIHNVLHDLVIDFPFASEADRQNFFGLMLTPIVAPALDGNRPLHLIGSSLERTGKTKLAEEVLGGVILGRSTSAMQLTDREEERDKRIMGLLLRGNTLLHLDNLPGFIDSSTLSSLITTPTYSGRILGGNEMPELPNHLTIVATGNNVQASGEMAKRIVPIILQPTTPEPESRRKFHHPNLRAFVRQERATVLACLLGLVENWLANSQPRHPRSIGGFEDWSAVIGGILSINGLTKWRTNERAWRKRSNPRGEALATFVQEWHAQYGHGEVEAGELRELARASDVFDWIFAKRTPQAVSVAFGRLLQRSIDAPVGQWFIRYDNAGRRAKYRLEAIA